MKHQSETQTDNSRQLAIAQAAVEIDAILDELADAYPGAEEEILAALIQM